VDTANFSTALRAALRQDPDVILVGEMRDLETISTALLAAETGHLFSPPCILWTPPKPFSASSRSSRRPSKSRFVCSLPAHS